MNDILSEIAFIKFSILFEIHKLQVTITPNLNNKISCLVLTDGSLVVSPYIILERKLTKKSFISIKFSRGDYLKLFQKSN
jgi:hypothetical protein